VSEALPHSDSADVALLLEGTFPYVSGGVSSWVNQIIRAFPEIRFAIVFIGSRPTDYGPMRYPLPANVVHLERHFIHDFAPRRAAARDRAGDAAGFADVAQLHDAFHAFSARVQHCGLELFPRLAEDLVAAGRISLDDFLHSEMSWDFVTESYKRYCQDPSFVDYFWTVRIMHTPLWQLGKVARDLIPVRAFHAVSTGYAGFLGALLKHVRKRPLVLTEHGIYTKERKIDLFQSQWIRDNRNVFQRDVAELPYFRQMWIRFFEWLGRFCYEAADPILSLYEANRLRQIDDGADAARTRCIPNGISLARFAPLRAQRGEAVPLVLCLIGRVVSIKDIKTFIRAMRRVVNQMPEAEGWIAGPEDEDPAYAEECRHLAVSLGLAEKIRFLGFQAVHEILPKVGLVVLSSISEALPLVILEGYAAGVPTVSTDVGSCRQLVEGLADEDCALGRSGRIVRIADPQGLADAALELLQSPAAWHAASAAGVARVERYYNDELMFQRYRAVYGAALAVTGE
jgi:glycosyltransferase involved in cell wall biosynthesis